MQSASKLTLAAVLALYAGTGTTLAKHSGLIEAALDRAIAVRAGHVAPAGTWSRGYIPENGRQVYIELADDNSEDYNLWIGANGAG